MDTHGMAGTESPRVLITAGPTAEDIDPIRFITNRSSGRMGMEIAEAVLKAGGSPLLILGPTALPAPEGVPVVPVRSAADMARAVTEYFPWADALVMAAAVADYTPAEPMDVKLKKADGDLVLRLKRTTDILASIKDSPLRRDRFMVGFSLDVDVNIEEGKRKLQTKNLDIIVVNSVSSFGAGKENARIVSRDDIEDCGEISKRELAARIVRRIIARK